MSTETQFPDSFLEAVGRWQNGWSEDQARRALLADALRKESLLVPSEFRAVDSPCYRKRFLTSGEVIPLMLRNLHDGTTSWSTDRQIAEEFKYRLRPDTITGVVFEHKPSPSEVVLNISRLSNCRAFIEAAEDYLRRGMPMAQAIFNFLGERSQHEVVLDAPLYPENVVTLSGETNTSFADFCKEVRLPGLLEDQAWKELLARDLQPQAPSFIRDEAAQRVILRAVETLERLLERAHR